MKSWKKLAVFLCFLAIPYTVSAYSSNIILGGENIGIHLESNGIFVIGFYKVNGEYVKGNPSLEVGDKIIKVEDRKVNSITELTNAIESEMKNNEVTLTVLRNKEELHIRLPLQYIDGTFKTGLYVKDSITGIGTLTYIDPETKIYGSLGHEILESTTSAKVEVKTGSIFESSVTGIEKSTDGHPGEKNASFNKQNVYGNITKNTDVGLFGNYTKEIEGTLMPVATKEEVKIGTAYIYTVLANNSKERYTIDIQKINVHNHIKNIYFEITDERLLKKTGGIVQGMSGSPIVQNISGTDKIIGCVTHVIVDNVKTGYGVFIETMLEEGEK